MAEGNSLINLGDLSKPATVLIEKVSSAVGLLYEPRRIKKKAEAEVEAEKIKALASIELNDIQQRAIDRMVQQEARKQENIEAVTAQAAASLDDTANVEDLDEDWIAHLFKNCDTVSDKEMQSLWSSLLYGEATRPGTFSKRTIDFVASMDKKDAELFTKFCQFCWFLGSIVIPVVHDPSDEIYKKQGINFEALKHLDAIGLISFEPVSGYKRTGMGRYISMFYFEKPVTFEFKKDQDNDLDIGKVLVTQAGQELAPICGARENNGFYEYAIEKWFRDGLILSTPLLNK